MRSVELNVRCPVECDTGYTTQAVGSQSGQSWTWATCKTESEEAEAEPQWQVSDEFFCEKLSCDTADGGPFMPFGDITASYAEINDVVGINCLGNHELSVNMLGRNELVCRANPQSTTQGMYVMADGTTAGSTHPPCVPVVCPMPREDHGTWIRTMGSDLVLTCSAGHMPDPLMPSYAFCYANGTFEVQPGRCIPDNGCNVADLPVMGNPEPNNCTEQMLQDQRCMVQCPPNMGLQAVGSWVCSSQEFIGMSYCMLNPTVLVSDTVDFSFYGSWSMSQDMASNDTQIMEEVTKGIRHLFTSQRDQFVESTGIYIYNVTDQYNSSSMSSAAASRICPLAKASPGPGPM